MTLDGEMSARAAIVDAADQVRAAGGDEPHVLRAGDRDRDGRRSPTPGSTSPCSRSAWAAGSTRPTSSIRPVAVVTGVAIDHEAILGDTLAKIAAEKAGIWKPGRPAIVGTSGLAEAVPVLASAARAAGAPVS